MKEGDSMYFATDDENERQLWVQAIYRATGQTHKPTPPVQQSAPTSDAAMAAAAPNTNAASAKGGMKNLEILLKSTFK